MSVSYREPLSETVGKRMVVTGERRAWAHFLRDLSRFRHPHIKGSTVRLTQDYCCLMRGSHCGHLVLSTGLYGHSQSGRASFDKEISISINS